MAEETSKHNKSKRNSSTSQNVDKRLGYLRQMRRDTLSYSSSSECSSFDDDAFVTSGSSEPGVGAIRQRVHSVSSKSCDCRSRSVRHSSSSSCDSGVLGDYCRCYRVIMMGPSSVGKTSIITQLLHNQYSEQHTPTLQSMHSCEVETGAAQITLTIEDTGGSFIQEFPAMAELS